MNKTKTCELPECDKTFEPKRKNSRFCCVGHSNIASKRKIRGYAPRRSCDICGRNISTKNKHGVCTTNSVCFQEYQRRHVEANKEHIQESKHQKYLAKIHDEITYLVFSPGLNTHKIGITTYLDARLNTLRCGCWDIELITTFPYGRKLEQWLHAYFDAKRIEGTEWFTDLTEVDVKNAVAEYELETD